MHRLFRGLSAAASLKLREQRRVGADGHLFRGLSAAASLKHRKGRRRSAIRRLFRGLSAAASLKPLRCMRGQGRECASSAASVPRPH